MSRYLVCTWTDSGTFEPIQRQRKECDAIYAVGARYVLEAIEERSYKSHRSFMATVNEAWRNLPEGIADEFPTPTHLRRRALIATGWRDETAIVCSTPEEAARVAAFVWPADEFQVVSVAGTTVVRWVAKSQKTRGDGAMNKADFQKSQDDVRSWIAALLKVEPAALEGAESA